MNRFSISVFCALGFATVGRGQLTIPLADVSLAYPGISGATIELGGIAEFGLPTPFVIQGLIPNSALWFCMDPLQTIYFNGSGEPAGASLNYVGTNPTDFDKWSPLAPGLTAARIQNLADLFTAYAPTQTNQLIGGSLQLAVWEIVNEFDGNPFDLANGQMRASGDALMLLTAQNMLDSLRDAGVSNQGNSSFLTYLIDGSYERGPSDVVFVQDLIGYAAAVPESGSFAIGVIALLLPLIGLKLRCRKLLRVC